MRVRTTIAAALLLSACGQPAPQQTKEQPKIGSDEQQQVHKLNEMDRAITFKRAIYASGYTCRRIDRSGYVAEYGNLSMWTAACSDKKTWAIFVGPDGSAQVRDCKDMAQFKLPECVIREERKAAPGG
ncbi:MAG: hypothetical protein ABIQ32_09890 [Sphingomicrobium sp.]